MRAWRGDWIARIRERVAEKGFATVTEFADARPFAPLVDLADELGVEDVAAVQLETVLRSEAEEAGRVGEFVRKLLVRRIHEAIPDGWGISEGYDFNFEASGAFANWIGALEDSQTRQAEHVWRRLRAANP